MERSRRLTALEHEPEHSVRDRLVLLLNRAQHLVEASAGEILQQQHALWSAILRVVVVIGAVTTAVLALLAFLASTPFLGRLASLPLGWRLCTVLVFSCPPFRISAREIPKLDDVQRPFVSL